MIAWPSFLLGAAVALLLVVAGLYLLAMWLCRVARTMPEGREP